MATANYDYTIPSWYQSDYQSKLAAANAAMEAWKYLPFSYESNPPPPPPLAEYGYMVPRGMSHVAAALQGLFEGRAQTPNFGDITDTGWLGWGNSGSGFEGAEKYASQLRRDYNTAGGWYGLQGPDEQDPSVGAAYNKDNSIGPALYPYLQEPRGWSGETDPYGYGLIATEFSVPDANSSGSWGSGHGQGPGSYQLRPGKDGYWWNNIWTAGRDSATDALSKSYANAIQDVRINLARKGELGGTSEKFALAQLKKDKNAINLGSYGDQAVDYFGNRINDDLSRWNSKLQTDWERTVRGKEPRWFEHNRRDLGDPEQPGSAYSETYFDPLITDATNNYNQSLSYAKGLSPDLGDAFAAAIARSERGGLSAKTNKGVGAPTAYFGDLARVGGWQEFIPTQEMANVFPGAQTGSSFSGAVRR